MFNGSRFFNLLRKWKDEDKKNYILILHDVMDDYFDRVAGYKKDKLEIKGYFPTSDIMYVLDSVGYHNYTIDRSEAEVIYVTLRNTL